MAGILRLRRSSAMAPASQTPDGEKAHAGLVAGVSIVAGLIGSFNRHPSLFRSCGRFEAAPSRDIAAPCFEDDFPYLLA